jgi:hypothetical protein
MKKYYLDILTNKYAILTEELEEKNTGCGHYTAPLCIVCNGFRQCSWFKF